MPKNSSRTIILTTVTTLALGMGVSSQAVAQPQVPAAQSTSRAATQTEPGTTLAAAAKVKPAVKFHSRSWLYRDIRKAPVSKSSKGMTSDLRRQIYGRYNGVAAVNAYQYNASFYRAAAKTPRQTVRFYDCQGKGYVPAGLFNGAKHFVNVPIPRNAVPAMGTDGNLTIYDARTDRLWEFWVAKRIGKTQQWKACWGGRIDHVSKNRGASFNGHFGATASGISFAGTMITVAEARKRQINHTMYLAIPEPKAGSVSWPAKRSDGFSHRKYAIPEGTVLRLDPKVNVDKLKLTPFGKTVARAAQKHGFIVADKAGAVNVSTESGAAERARTGKDPWNAIFGRTPSYSQLRGFPWTRMQALPKNYGQSAR